MSSFKLNVNERLRSVEVDPDTPLLWVIRDSLGLTGTKFGCGRGLCGACTVHIDGAVARSCVTTIDTVGDKKITTIEGLAKSGSHPVVRAWVDEQVPQCGYCQSGQIMTAAALLAEKPHPTDADIDAAMSMTLCRCGTYTRIRRAIHLAGEKGGGK